MSVNYSMNSKTLILKKLELELDNYVKLIKINNIIRK